MHTGAGRQNQQDLPVSYALAPPGSKCAAALPAAQLAAMAASHTVGSPARRGAAPRPPRVGATRIAVTCLVRHQSSGSAAGAAASGAACRQVTGNTAAGISKATQGHPAAAAEGAAGSPAARDEHLRHHLLNTIGGVRDLSAAAAALLGTLAAAAATQPGTADVSHATETRTNMPFHGQPRYRSRIFAGRQLANYPTASESSVPGSQGCSYGEPGSEAAAGWCT